MEALGKFVVGIGVGTGAALFIAWAMSVLWVWFAVPAGAVALPYFAFLGVSFAISLVSTWTTSQKDLDAAAETSLGKSVGTTVVKAFAILILLGVAGLFHLVFV